MCSRVQKFIGTHGARVAGIDCMNVLAALCATSSPEGEDPCSAQEIAMSAAFQKALLATDGLEVIVGVARSNGPPASAGFAATIVHEMFRTIGPDLCGTFAAIGGVAAMVRILQNTYVSLPQHAAAAGSLWYFLVPDQRLMMFSGGAKGSSAQLVGDAAAGALAGRSDEVRYPPFLHPYCLHFGVAAASLRALLKRKVCWGGVALFVLFLDKHALCTEHSGSALSLRVHRL
jgi:hypothetical protein